MKLSELFKRGDQLAQELLNEVPYLHQGKFITKTLEVSYSKDAIQRDFEPVGTIGVYHVYIHESKRFVIAIDPRVPNKSGRFEPVFKLDFKKNIDLEVPLSINTGHLVQVDSVATTDTKKLANLASSIYKMLVQAGYQILSDNSQFDPGAGLWKKLARESSGYKVYVVHVELGIMRDPDDSSKPMIYDGVRIGDSAIWTSGGDFRGANWLLMMAK